MVIFCGMTGTGQAWFCRWKPIYISAKDRFEIIEKATDLGAGGEYRDRDGC